MNFQALKTDRKYRGVQVLSLLEDFRMTEYLTSCLELPQISWHDEVPLTSSLLCHSPEIQSEVK